MNLPTNDWKSCVLNINGSDILAIDSSLFNELNLLAEYIP
jgi:hypothetical protein